MKSKISIEKRKLISTGIPQKKHAKKQIHFGGKQTRQKNPRKNEENIKGKIEATKLNAHITNKLGLLMIEECGRA